MMRTAARHLKTVLEDTLLADDLDKVTTELKHTQMKLQVSESKAAALMKEAEVISEGKCTR